MAPGEEIQRAYKAAADFQAGNYSHNFTPFLQDLAWQRQSNPQGYGQFLTDVNDVLQQQRTIPGLEIVSTSPQNDRMYLLNHRTGDEMAVDARGGKHDLYQAASKTDNPTDGSRTVRYENGMQVTQFRNTPGFRSTSFNPDGSQITLGQQPHLTQDVYMTEQYPDGSAMCIDKQGRVLLSSDGQGHTREFHYNPQSGAIDKIKGFDGMVWSMDARSGNWVSQQGQQFAGKLLSVDSAGTAHYYDNNQHTCFGITRNGAVIPEMVAQRPQMPQPQIPRPQFLPPQGYPPANPQQFPQPGYPQYPNSGYPQPQFYPNSGYPQQQIYANPGYQFQQNMMNTVPGLLFRLLRH